MTPDVSSVLGRLATCESFAGHDEPEWIRIRARDALQQAAEQACYRYALSVVGRIGCSGACVPLVRCLACREVAALLQLIAGSV